jgi:hypothetical protein
MRDLILTLHDQQENKASEKALPNVGEILLPPITPPRSWPNGSSVLTDDGEETKLCMIHKTLLLSMELVV